MTGATSLENAVASLQGAAWSGRIYRVMLNDYPPDRENIQGARWNLPDVARFEGKNLVIYPGRANESYSFTTVSQKIL